ncbi:GNAT family N-acetyltransferase [Flindersiella endophytica]
MDEVRIRPMRSPDDIEAVVDLYTEEATWHSDHWPEDYRAPEFGEDFRKYLREPPETTCRIVAEAGNRLVGFVTGHLEPEPKQGVVRHDGPFVIVADVAVTSEYRRRGIATRLLDALEGWATEHGATSLVLYVHAGNEPAKNLYEKRGFRPVNVQMRKDLS